MNPLLLTPSHESQTPDQTTELASESATTNTADHTISLMAKTTTNHASQPVTEISGTHSKKKIAIIATSVSILTAHLKKLLPIMMMAIHPKIILSTTMMTPQ